MSVQGRQIGHVVIEYNQASGQPDIADNGYLHDTYNDAKRIAQELRAECRSRGRRESYAVARVVLESDPE